MRNDSRPIGEKLRDTERSISNEQMTNREMPQRPNEQMGQKPRKPFVTNRDVGDEERSER